jgi:uncharacterized protein involved in propanediol utilization
MIQEVMARYSMTTPLRAGTGTARHHHGEILQGACTRAGTLTPCLITMPGRGCGSTARYVRMTHEPLQVLPRWKIKAAEAARLALEHLDEAPLGLLEIECSVETGIGLGSSTCDVVAAIRAVCAAYGARLAPERVARIAVEAEGAADPIMFEDEVVVFAQRHGEVLESFGNWIPSLTVLSLDMDSARGGIETLGLPFPKYTPAELAVLESLIGAAREAFRGRDAAAIARVATASAKLNQRFVPMRAFDDVCALAERYDALGVQISHSGTVAGILFDPRCAPLESDILTRARADAQALGARPLGQFTTLEQAPT